MPNLKFTKMHGLGNDFVVIDGISQTFDPSSAPIAAWADRHTGIGFDQLLLVEAPHLAEADFRYRIFNADGGEVEQCGNGARCFARFVLDKGLSDKRDLAVETARGIIRPKLTAEGLVQVDMGEPFFKAEEIPAHFFPADIFAEVPQFAEYENLQVVEVNGQRLAVFCVGMGNPHGVIQVDDIEAAPVQTIGQALESHPMFPERANIGFMQVVSRSSILLRVFERGAKETRACGTGACAAVVAGICQGLLDEGALITVTLPGGVLQVTWSRETAVFMTGEAKTVFEGVLTY